MCNLYKFGDREFLGYLNESEEFELPEYYQIELVKEQVNIADYPKLDIIHLSELGPKTNTRDHKLNDYGIRSYTDLANARVLIVSKELNAPAQVREMVMDKYAEIMEFLSLE